ncbi:bacterioferritin-associated ferredoxin [Phaeovulum sp.]|uniref:(2Fe-2S)-binding protein n=1 Tax=Phaeovulum sp. TaxID=2934796 RepID=UPI0039E6A01C
MIVCHCMNITNHQIRAAVDWMRAADPATIITPGKVYRALGKRADCGGCMPLFLDTMRSCASLKVAGATEADRSIPNLGTGKYHEGRRQSHRVSERGTAV